MSQTQTPQNTILVCETCAGTGAVIKRGYDEVPTEKITCPTCEGSGLVMQEIRYVAYKPTHVAIRVAPN